MSDRLFVSTRKGLFSFVRGSKGWSIERVSFLGDAVSLSFHDAKHKTLYAALGLGHFGVKLRRSSDYGATWEEIAAPAFPKEPEGHKETFADGKPWPWRVEQIWSLETAGDTLFCGTIGGGLFRSKDRGASWDIVSSLWDHPKRKEWVGGGADLPGIHSICVHPADPKKITIGVSCGGVWRSENAGETWELSSDGMFAAYMPPARAKDPAIQDPHRVVQCRSNPNRFWAQHHNGVFRSDDGARTWNEVPNALPSVFGFGVAVDPNDGDTAWFVPAVKDETRVPVDAKVVVARTRDGGKSFEVLRNGLPQDHAYDITFRHALAIDGSGRRLVFGSTTGSLWITENAGDAWTNVSTHLPPIYATEFG